MTAAAPTPAVLVRTCVVGGAGFIGTHVVRRLLARPGTEAVTIFDNFSSGRRGDVKELCQDDRVGVVEADVRDLETLAAALAGHDTVVHLASNPDIARAVTDPAVDFDQGTLLTHNVTEACRRAGVGLVLYASGSGVYGDLGEVAAREDHGPMRPTSTYGASKLAGEAMLCSYAAMFGLRVRAFRFGNVVGPRQTHGVGYDFAHRLLADPTRLRILGDGRQSKSYVWVDDVIDALFAAAGDAESGSFQVYNVATGDYIDVTAIAEIACREVGLSPGVTVFEYTGGDRGWKGDVPVVRLNTERILGLGWRPSRTSGEAIAESVRSMIGDLRAGRLDGA